VGGGGEQPPRQVERGILMRQNQPLKPLSIRRLQHARSSSP
jgi:hypothetical protein